MVTDATRFSAMGLVEFGVESVLVVTAILGFTP